MFLHENDSFLPQLVLIVLFCDSGTSASRGTVSGGGAALVMLGGDEGPFIPEATSCPNSGTATKTPPSAQEDPCCRLQPA